MNMQTPARVAARQRARAADDYVADLGRRPSGVVSLRQNRFDAPPAKTQRARRVRAARRATRYARRMGWSA